MPVGPGKYDDECTLVRKRTKAKHVLLIVIEGDRGTGFSFQTSDPANVLRVPDVLEDVAREIRKGLEQGRIV